MMKALSFSHRNLLVFVLPALIFTTVYWITTTAAFADNSSVLSKAITIDILLLAPLVHLLIIRRTKIPKLTVIPVFVLGIFIAQQILPNEHHEWLNIFKFYVLPVIELTVFSLIIYKVRQLIKVYRTHKTEVDFYSALQQGAKSILPERAASLFVSEIAMFYYALFWWRRKKLTKNQYTYHQNSGTPALLFTLIIVVSVELLALHFLLIENTPVLAWVLTGLSLYSGLQLVAFGKSLMARPYLVSEEGLELNYGILSQLKVDFNQIGKVELVGPGEEIADQSTLSPLKKLDQYNVRLIFREPVTLTYIYGFKKQVSELLIFVDQKEDFVAAIQECIIGENSY